MTQQLSNEEAEEILRLAMPVALGMGVGAGAGFIVETTTSLPDDYNAQLEINSQISQKNEDIEALQSANTLLGEDPVISESIQAAQDQVAELNVQSEQYGNEALNLGEAYGLPLVLGATVALLGVRRAMRKSVLFGRNS